MQYKMYLINWFTISYLKRYKAIYLKEYGLTDAKREFFWPEEMKKFFANNFLHQKLHRFTFFLAPLPDKRGEKIILKNNLKFYVFGLGNQCVTP